MVLGRQKTQGLQKGISKLPQRSKDHDPISSVNRMVQSTKGYTSGFIRYREQNLRRILLGLNRRNSFRSSIRIGWDIRSNAARPNSSRRLKKGSSQVPQVYCSRSLLPCRDCLDMHPTSLLCLRQNSTSVRRGTKEARNKKRRIFIRGYIQHRQEISSLTKNF